MRCPPNLPIKIIITDDHPIFTEGLEGLFRLNKAFEVIAICTNGIELLEILKTESPDVILLDLNMPFMSGDEVIKVLLDKFPHLKIILLSMDFDKEMVLAYFSLGIHGYLPKSSEFDTLVESINMVVSSGTAKEISLLELERIYEGNTSNVIQKFGLSSREIEVIKWIRQGKRNKHIADILNVTERTVEFHKTNIYRKTKCDCIAELVNFANKYQIR